MNTMLGGRWVQQVAIVAPPAPTIVRLVVVPPIACFTEPHADFTTSAAVSFGPSCVDTVADPSASLTATESIIPSRAGSAEAMRCFASSATEAPLAVALLAAAVAASATEETAAWASVPVGLEVA
jgi:hypothetical protein